MKIYNESLPRGKNVYIGKKKDEPCHTNWKKSKDKQLVGQKKKSPLRLLSYNAKSAQYWEEQNIHDNYLVSQELTFYIFA